MTWSHDMSAAPRGKTITVQRLFKDKNSAYGEKLVSVEEFETDYLWLATECGKVIKSYCIPETKHSRGRWAGVNAPIAWQPFIVPDHPSNKGIESGANAAADNSALGSDSSHEEAATEGKFDVTQ